PHLDARAEFGGELAHQLAEVDAAVGGEIEHELRAVERLLDFRQLHAEPALAHLQRRQAKRLGLAMLMLEPRHDVVACREADDALRRVWKRPALLLELGNRSDDSADRRAALGLNHDLVAGTRSRLLAREEGLDPPHGRQLHGDERRAIRDTHGTPLYISDP